MARISTGRRILFASIPLLFLVGLAEIFVRVTHVAESCPNRFSGTEFWTCDPILQFKLSPDLDVLGRRLSRDGFRTHEFDAQALRGSTGFSRSAIRAPSACSCAGSFGYVRNPYPLALEKLLADRVGPGRFEVLNAGVPGYNSYHGLMLLRGKLRGLDPDLITVRYGWNDHFLSEYPPEPGPLPGVRRARWRSRSRIWRCAPRSTRSRGASRSRCARGAGRAPTRCARRSRARRSGLPRSRCRITSTTCAASSRSGTRAARRSGCSPRRTIRRPSEAARNFIAFNNKISYEEMIAIHEQYNDATRRWAASWACR